MFDSGLLIILLNNKIYQFLLRAKRHGYSNALSFEIISKAFDGIIRGKPRL